jgi:hypothetical protein
MTELEVLQEVSTKLDALQEISTKLDTLNNLLQVSCFLIGILSGILLGLIFWSVLKE